MVRLPKAAGRVGGAGMAAQFRADEEFVEIFAGPGRATHSDEDMAIELLTT
jgi:hypothetical protein